MSVSTTVQFLVDDTFTPAQAKQRIILTLATAKDIEAVGVGWTVEAVVAQGWCRMEGGHKFYSPALWPAGQPLPDVCPRHRANAYMDQLHAAHAPLFEQLQEQMGFTAYLQHSGGGVWTFVVLLREPNPAWRIRGRRTWGMLESVGAAAGTRPNSEGAETGEHLDAGIRLEELWYGQRRLLPDLPRRLRRGHPARHAGRGRLHPAPAGARVGRPHPGPPPIPPGELGLIAGPGGRPLIGTVRARSRPLHRNSDGV